MFRAAVRVPLVRPLQVSVLLSASLSRPGLRPQFSRTGQHSFSFLLSALPSSRRHFASGRKKAEADLDEVAALLKELEGPPAASRPGRRASAARLALPEELAEGAEMWRDDPVLGPELQKLEKLVANLSAMNEQLDSEMDDRSTGVLKKLTKNKEELTKKPMFGDKALDDILMQPGGLEKLQATFSGEAGTKEDRQRMVAAFENLAKSGKLPHQLVEFSRIAVQQADGVEPSSEELARILGVLSPEAGLEGDPMKQLNDLLADFTKGGEPAEKEAPENAEVVDLLEGDPKKADEMIEKLLEEKDVSPEQAKFDRLEELLGRLETMQDAKMSALDRDEDDEDDEDIDLDAVADEAYEAGMRASATAKEGKEEPAASGAQTDDIDEDDDVGIRSVLKDKTAINRDDPDALNADGTERDSMAFQDEEAEVEYAEEEADLVAPGPESTAKGDPDDARDKTQLDSLLEPEREAIFAKLRARLQKDKTEKLLFEALSKEHQDAYLRAMYEREAQFLLDQKEGDLDGQEKEDHIDDEDEDDEEHEGDGEGPTSAEELGRSLLREARRTAIEELQVPETQREQQQQQQQQAQAAEKQPPGQEELGSRVPDSPVPYHLPAQELMEHKHVVKVSRHVKITRGGRKESFSAFVLVGNGKGTAGLGYGRGPEPNRASDKALRDAHKNLVTFELWENRTIPFPVTATHCKTKVIMRPFGAHTGLRMHDSLVDLCEAVGVQDLFIKVTGRRHIVHAYKAIFDTLQEVRGPETMARDLGKVFYNPARTYVPKSPYGL
jgi:small subunit ribosomal protein S5